MISLSNVLFLPLLLPASFLLLRSLAMCLNPLPVSLELFVVAGVRKWWELGSGV